MKTKPDDSMDGTDEVESDNSSVDNVDDIGCVGQHAGFILHWMWEEWSNGKIKRSCKLHAALIESTSIKPCFCRRPSTSGHWSSAIDFSSDGSLTDPDNDGAGNKVGDVTFGYASDRRKQFVVVAYEKRSYQKKQLHQLVADSNGGKTEMVE